MKELLNNIITGEKFKKMMIDKREEIAQTIQFSVLKQFATLQQDTISNGLCNSNAKLTAVDIRYMIDLDVSKIDTKSMIFKEGFELGWEKAITEIKNLGWEMHYKITGSFYNSWNDKSANSIEFYAI